MANKRTRTKTSKVKAQYQPFYFVVGLVLLFFSILASFEWGALGILFVNLLRLLIGELYSLGLVGFFFYAVYLMIKGDAGELSSKRLGGGLLILTSLTLYLHLRTFYPLLDPSVSIFNQTFATFKEDLLTSQTLHSLGGGMLGAFLSYLFSYLFGIAGSKLLSFILFIVGLIFIVDRSLLDMPLVFQKSVKNMEGFPQSFKNMGQHLKEIFNQEELEEEEDEEVTIEVPSSKTQTLKEKLVSVFKQDVIDKETPPILHSDHDHNIKPENMDQFETYSQSDPKASTAQSHRPLNVVLDLDYFDEDTTQVASDDTSHYLEEASNEPIESSFSSPESQNVNEEPVPLQAAHHWQQESGVASTTENEVEESVKKEQPSIKKDKKRNRSQTYQLPTKALLTKIPPVDQTEEYQRINQNIEKLELTFKSFGVDAKVVKANLGPSVTKYEIEPAIGVKVSRIVSLADDIALSLAARDIRIEAPIPGKSLIGIEVPNHQVSPVSFWEIIDPALKSPHLLEVPMGRDISGKVQLADLSKMPHLLIAGATGSGKSVGMNVIITSLLMKATPEQVKFLMVDPKKVEFAMYDGIPHLLTPVVTNPRKAAQALNKVVLEMERRYEMFAAMSVRNIDGYNDQVDDYNKENQTDYEKMPRIVVFVDELADLMLVASNDVEQAIIRLAQMARAAGIHMILATQRPSVDVITGIIKANIPSRLAFAVSSGTDSRTIIDSNGAEKLLGRGDMLFQPMGMNKPIRIQGAYISDEEVERITEFIKEQRQEEYDESMIVTQEAVEQAEQSDDEYFDEVVELIKHQDTISISQLQRQFRIGYNRAARLVDDLEALGMIGPSEGSKPRQVLITENIQELSENQD
ncbi:FtsK/SpoIIIE family DNA translocase [Dolosicoccus paucivorans]|uniref:DNA translocase FtsK n=1 Tax=Dolosicoccus paucivorans TaxID=84521 RepID=A0A2N6SLM0_9LACT|nr:DNA translocase FtsK [Dolosicoccus paucivorans]PMB83829.1 DNA translocase FtsK [Dolosicoccus paucivorans]PMC57974.1 DNA translocase FtsK [Dolosicoccus paucivorans]